MDSKIELARRQRPVNRNNLWYIRFRRFRRDGFSRSEATWAADGHLKLGDPVVRLVRKARRLFVRDYMRVFKTTRNRAIEAARRALTDRNRRFGMSGRELYNIFREISP